MQPLCCWIVWYKKTIVFGVTILGNNSAVPAFDRHPTSQVVTIDDSLLLLDCGEGTQTQLSRYKIRRSKIKHICISHLHGDHYFGLIGLITSMGLLGRDQELHLHAPAPLLDIIQLQLKVADTQLPYPLNFQALQPAGGLLATEKKFTLHAFPVQHRVPCWGFKIEERKNPRRINNEACVQYGVPSSFYERLKLGEDYTDKNGHLIANNTVTTANTPARSYAYCADTVYTENILPHINNVSLLYHETTYLHDLAERATSRFHSTTVQAATIAQKAGVEKLIIGHFSSKYELLDAFLAETSAVFANTQLAIEGVSYPI
jgi:ribonuclease Z